MHRCRCQGALTEAEGESSALILCVELVDTCGVCVSVLTWISACDGAINARKHAWHIDVFFYVRRWLLQLWHCLW